MIEFIFCPGFGLSHHFFQQIEPFFQGFPVQYWNPSYFCEEEQKVILPQSASFRVGIGHSLGFSKLVQRHPLCHCLIGLHGFSDFLGKDPMLREKRTQEWRRFEDFFHRSPRKTLIHFYRQCGLKKAIHWNKLEKMNIPRLLFDLKFLSAGIALPQDVPVLIIGSRDDKIVTPELLHDNFGGCSQVMVTLLDTGQHSLGFQEPYTLYKKIMEFVHENGKRNDQKSFFSIQPIL